MGPKYKWATNEDGTIISSGGLKRIQHIETGELGGWIESENNLSQEGSCWVKDNARVDWDAHVCENAIVSGNAYVTREARISGSARVYGEAVVQDFAQVKDEALVYEKAVIKNRAQIVGASRIFGSAEIANGAKVVDSNVSGQALVCDYAEVSSSIIHGNTSISGQGRNLRILMDYEE